MRALARFTSLAVALSVWGVAARADENDKDSGKTEVDLVPIVGGDSDIGWGVGGVGAVTRLMPHSRDRWAWRVEASAFATLRTSPLQIAYQDHWLLLTVPGLVGGFVRVQARAAFTEEKDVRYFGIGNATSQPSDSSSPYFMYRRTHPTFATNARALIAPHVFATLGASLTYDWMDVPAGGKLASDLQSGSPEVRKLLGDAGSHAVAFIEEAVSWDDRDDEVVTRRGSWDELDLRVSPAFGSGAPYEYEEITAIARTYTPLGPRFTLAIRGVADALLGRPPFYQLTNYQDTYALGGINAVRGVPAQLYYGKVKIFGNVEIRADIVHFQALAKPWGLALVAFLDGGRLWADWSAQPQLDGRGAGLKWGTGLGVRLEEGTEFVVRGDLAWSPDSRPVGAYFAAGETF